MKFHKELLTHTQLRFAYATHVSQLTRHAGDMKRLRGAYANRYGQTLSTTPQHELTRSLRAIGSSHKHVSTHLIGIDWFPSIPILEN